MVWSFLTCSDESSTQVQGQKNKSYIFNFVYTSGFGPFHPGLNWSKFQLERQQGEVGDALWGSGIVLF